MYALGAIAQLVEHLNGIEGVSGSSPLSSIKFDPVGAHDCEPPEKQGFSWITHSRWENPKSFMRRSVQKPLGNVIKAL